LKRYIQAICQPRPKSNGKRAMAKEQWQKSNQKINEK
jgi:hypothetical protein